jgi:GH43 family beta-xylosidase
MNSPTTQSSIRSYLNPVHDREFPDPFVLKYRGEYWAYCTGLWHDGRAFGVMRSRDLVQWHELAGAMEPLPGDDTCYWAPEVAYYQGRFYMYYSVGNEEQMQIRAAVAEHPGGPFVDSGHRLTTEPFAIDAHVFEDDDGARYLFYATDFLEHSHIGTGTVRDRMLDPFTLEGKPQPVTRALFDWQVYDPARVEKGGARWHTVEGPFVLKHKGLYYQMFSGGNWQNPSYGASYALSNDIDITQEWYQVCDGEQVLPVLRTIPGEVIGPGHNSAVQGPDNQQWFCVYHRWAQDGSARLLAIDRLDWAGHRMLVLGPSTEPQPAPVRPTFVDYFDDDDREDLGDRWQVEGGAWKQAQGEARQEAGEGSADASLATGAAHFVVEVSLRALVGSGTGTNSSSGAGVRLVAEGETVLQFMLAADGQHAQVGWKEEDGWRDRVVSLPESFALESYHLLRLEVDGRSARVELDRSAARWEGRLNAVPERVALHTETMAAAYSGFSLSVGWQDLFVEEGWRAEEPGWEGDGDAAEWIIEEQQLKHAGQGEGAVFKGPLLWQYEFVVNARLRDGGATGGYGFYPLARDDEPGPLLALERSGEGWGLRWSGPLEERLIPLPEGFDPLDYQQFRFEKGTRQLHIAWEARRLATIEIEPQATRVGLYSRGAATALDMVRVTAIE